MWRGCAWGGGCGVLRVVKKKAEPFALSLLGWFSGLGLIVWKSERVAPHSVSFTPNRCVKHTAIVPNDTRKKARPVGLEPTTP